MVNVGNPNKATYVALLEIWKHFLMQILIYNYSNLMRRDYLKDARRVYDVLKKGGIAIVYMRNAYAIMSGTDNALQKVYTAKKEVLIDLVAL